MRGKLKDKEYFDEFIKTYSDLVDNNLNKLQDNSIKEDRIHNVQHFTVGLISNIIFAKYSRGDEMFNKDVLEYIKKAMSLINESWKTNHLNIMSIKKGNQIEFLNQYTLSGYLRLINMASLSILLNVSYDHFKLLISYIDKDNVQDSLLEFLINYYDKERPILDNESYRETFDINNRYGRLKDIIVESDKVKASKELKCFLEKEWYNSFKGTPLYNQHKKSHSIYHGYWCFVAAAIVKVKDLDDTSFRGNQYYPKDLV